MLWTALTVVVGVVTLLVVVGARRHAGMDDLGSLSAHWIAEHRSHEQSLPRADKLIPEECVVRTVGRYLRRVRTSRGGSSMGM